MVEQFGLAIILALGFKVWGFTSGTTRGTEGSILQALELSITKVPLSANLGENSFDKPAPAEKIAISDPEIDSFSMSFTITPSPLNLIFFPGDLALAYSRRFFTGNFR